MSVEIEVYGAKGSGSVVVEAALCLMGVPYRLIEEPALGDPAREMRAAAVNPLRQVPAVVLPTGEVLTESAAILIRLCELHPEAALAPAIGDGRRGQFLRWMAYVSAAIYSLYWIRDDPARLAADEAAQGVVLERTAARIADCWRMMDEQVSPGRYILGDTLTVLDLYVAVASRWRPRRRRFYEVAPKMSAVVRRIDADPRLAALWADRMPFVEGWEG